jgi:flavin-dependent dehydrogenase
MEKKNCDVLVIGGGPAGLITTLSLSNNGFSTIILEKKKTINNSTLKYDITEGNQIEKILKEFNIRPNKISHKSEWISPNNSYILESKIKDFYFRRWGGINSIETDLLKKVTESGSNVLFESKIKSVKIKNKNIERILTNNISISPKYVVFAEGKTSRFERFLNINSKIFNKFIGFGAVIKSNIKDIIPHTKIYFDKKIAPGGYIYSGSVDFDTFFCVVIDADFTNSIDLKKNLESFIKSKMKDTKICNYFEGVGISGLKDTIKGNALLVGGNALFHDPFLGYGINFAIESGYYAALSIIHDKQEIYLDYTKAIQSRMEKMLFAREIMKKADNKFFDNLINALNGKNPDENSKFVELLDLFQD